MAAVATRANHSLVRRQHDDNTALLAAQAGWHDCESSPAQNAHCHSLSDEGEEAIGYDRGDGRELHDYYSVLAVLFRTDRYERLPDQAHYLFLHL
jgi:hypothetical protein